MVKLRPGIALLLLALLVLGASAGAAAKQQARGGVGTAQRLDGKVVRDLNGILATARNQLRQLARLPSVRTQDPAACNQDMAARARSPRYTALGAINLDGDVYCLSSPFTPPVNVSDRAYFLRAIGTKAFGVGDFQISKTTGINSVGLGYASRGPDGAVNGITVSPLALPWLNAHLKDTRPPGALDVLIVDGHGTVLARAGRRHTPSGVNLGSSRLVNSMVRQARGAGLFQFAGGPVISAWDTVPLSVNSIRVAVSVRP